MRAQEPWHVWLNSDRQSVALSAFRERPPTPLCPLANPMAKTFHNVSNASGLDTAVKALYPPAETGVFGLMQRLRIRICPFDVILDHLPAKSRVLDIGCGGGLLLGLAHRLGGISTGLGVDLSTPAVACAQTMAQRENPAALDFRILDVTKPQALPDSFDVVTMVDLIHHIPPARQRLLIQTAAAQVQPGGLFIFKDMSSTPFLCASWNRMHDLIMARQWIHYVTSAQVVEWGQASGLELVEQGQRRLYLYHHFWLVFRRPL